MSSAMELLVKHMRNLNAVQPQAAQVIAKALGLRLNKYYDSVSAGAAAAYMQQFDMAQLPLSFTLRERSIIFCECLCTCDDGCAFYVKCCSGECDNLLAEFREPTAGHLHTSNRDELRFLDEVLLVKRNEFDNWPLQHMATARQALSEYLEGDFLATLPQS